MAWSTRITNSVGRSPRKSSVLFCLIYQAILTVQAFRITGKMHRESTNHVIHFLVHVNTNYHGCKFFFFSISIIDFNIVFSSLRSLIEKPPIGGKELNQLTGIQLTGFRLHPGPVWYVKCCEQYIKHHLFRGLHVQSMVAYMYAFWFRELIALFKIIFYSCQNSIASWAMFLKEKRKRNTKGKEKEQCKKPQVCFWTVQLYFHVHV